MKPKILLSVSSKKENYINAINNSGGIAVAEYCPEASAEYAGLLLCGGNDIDPIYYNESINGSVDIDTERDKAEFELVKAFVEMNKPIMGICRGCQLLNIAFGGNMYQHILNADEHSAEADDLIHKVTVTENNFLSNIYGTGFSVNSHHHQAIKNVANGFDIIAVAGDTIEAIAHKELPVFGVQWHPERMCYDNIRDDAVDSADLFKYFVELCKNYN